MQFNPSVDGTPSLVPSKTGQALLTAQSPTIVKRFFIFSFGQLVFLNLLFDSNFQYLILPILPIQSSLTPL